MAVLFDIDDTLLDDRGAQDVYLGRLYSSYRLEIPYHEDEFRTAWRWSIDHHFARYLRGEVSLTDQRRARIRDVFNRPGMTDVAADRIVAEFLAEYEASWRLFPDVLQVLNELRGIALGVITNGNSEQQIRKLQRTGILDRFGVVVVSEAIGHAKPAPEIFQNACARLGCGTTSCVFVGDDWDRDVEGALRAGLSPVWLKRLGVPTDPERTHVPSIESLTALIERTDLRLLVGLGTEAS